MEIQKFEFKGEGLTRVYENAKWMVGIKNWKPANDITGIDCLERHNETDELFILLAGGCTLLSAEEGPKGLAIKAIKMEADEGLQHSQGAVAQYGDNQGSKTYPCGGFRHGGGQQRSAAA